MSDVQNLGFRQSAKPITIDILIDYGDPSAGWTSMADVNEYISRNNQKFAEHPLIAALGDDSIPPQRRLLIAPCMAFFSMGFSDINRYVYRDLSLAGDMFQDIVNEHTAEDETHSAWFISDCKKLGIDQLMTFPEALTFLWGKETIGVRRSIYDLAALLRFATPFERYVVLESLEGNGHVMFTATCKVATELSRETGKEYVFFGSRHLAMETGHATGEAIARLQQKIDAYIPTAQQFSRARILIDEVDAIFKRFNDDLYNYICTHDVGDKLLCKLY